MAFARPINSVISFNEILYKFDWQRWKCWYPIHVLLCSTLRLIVSGTCITQVNQFSLVDSNMLNTMSQTSSLQNARNGNRGSLLEHLRNSPGWDLAWAALSPWTVLCWSCSALTWSFLRNYSTGEAQPRGEEHVPLSHPKGTCHASVSVGSHSAGRDPSAKSNETFWDLCIDETPGNSHLSLQSDRAEEHHAWWELTGRGRPGKRRLWSTSSAKLTLLFFPPLSFDIKQIEWENGRYRHN